MTEKTILIVEDEAHLREILRDNLRDEGYAVLEARDGREGLDAALDRAPDLVVMDVMMPRMNGLDAVKALRQRGSMVPVVFLSAKGEEVDRVLGLELGADDYVTKPFSLRELLARIRVILRRTGEGAGASQNRIRLGDRVVDLTRFAVEIPDGNRLPLSHLEVRLLEMMIREKGVPLDRARLLDEVWGVTAYPTDRTVDNAIARLRKKIEGDPRRPRHLLTVHGVGYKFVD